MICRNVLTCKRLCLPVAGVLQLHFVPFVIASDQRERGDLNGATVSTAKRLPRRFAPRNDVVSIFMEYPG